MYCLSLILFFKYEYKYPTTWDLKTLRFEFPEHPVLRKILAKESLRMAARNE